MAEFSLPLTAEGAVTAPSGSFTYVEPSAESVTFLDVGPVHTLEIPEFGWAVADGVNPMRLITRGSVYDAGGLAPSAAPTLAVAGAARATVVGTYSGQPADGEFITIGRPSYSTTVTFKTTLVTDGSLGHQVKIGVDEDTTYTNLQKLIQGTGTQGTEYFNFLTFYGFVDSFQLNYFIEVSALDTGANTITLRYVTYGSIGNTSVSTENVSNFSFASATFTGGSDGTGTTPGSGTYRYFYTWYRDADGAETGRSPIATITQGTNTNIAVSSLADSADTTYDYIRVYRTPKDGVEFYLAGAIARGGAGTLTDDLDDEDLVVGTPWNDLQHRAYAEGRGPRGRALAYWDGAIWTTGALLAAEKTGPGTVSVAGPDSTASATVTFSAQGISQYDVGKVFQVGSTSEEYTILSVSEGGPTAVLDRLYEGATNAAATYSIRDAYDASAIRRCVPFLYNQWPVEESPGSVDTDDPEGGTALLATTSRLFAFSKTSIVSVTGLDAESWVVTKVAEGVGCVAPRMVLDIEGGGLFLALDGFYLLDPNGGLTCVSSPKAPKGTIAQGIDATVARIAWANIDQGYSVLDREDRVAIFGLPLDGAVVPNYELVFDLQNYQWALYKRAEWTASARVVMSNGDQILVSGDREGNVWHVGIGESDGFYGTEAVQTLTGAQTIRTLTVTGTPFSTSGDGEAGKPVLVLYADGTTVAYGKVASNTTSALTLTEDLDTAPAASDQIVLGGIAWQAKSGFTTFGEEYRQKILRSVTLRHAPTTRGEYFLSYAVDNGSFSLCPVGTSIGDLSDTDGKIRHMVQYPGDTHAINVRGFKPGGRAVLRGGVFDVIMREVGGA